MTESNRLQEIAAAMAGAKPRHPRRGRTPDELLAHGASAHTRTDTPDLSGVTVLIIEDHADSREMLRQIVASMGATVAVAEDGREALRAAGWVKPHLVLCDLRMPGLDGFAFLDTLRHHPELSRTPVIAVTALGSCRHETYVRSRIQRPPREAHRLRQDCDNLAARFLGTRG
jgi:CheY-like chemotaxis protein